MRLDGLLLGAAVGDIDDLERCLAGNSMLVLWHLFRWVVAYIEICDL